MSDDEPVDLIQAAEDRGRDTAGMEGELQAWLDEPAALVCHVVECPQCGDAVMTELGVEVTGCAQHSGGRR